MLQLDLAAQSASAALVCGPQALLVLCGGPPRTLVPMKPPSTDWSETVAADEQARHAAFVGTIVALQSRINAKKGPGRRSTASRSRP